MAKSKMAVKVYMDFINYEGKVSFSQLIAQFANMNWAKDFIQQAKAGEDQIVKIRVEEVQ